MSTAENAVRGDFLVLDQVQLNVDGLIRRLIHAPDERSLDEGWSSASKQLAEFALRPAKRVRPAFLIAGHAIATGRQAPESVWTFAAALELLHTFMLAHDDVADSADTRRGGPSLHRMLAPERKLGEDLAIVAGDLLFARALELMLSSGAPGAAAATSYMLEVCRQTAVGQFMDLSLSRAALSDVTLFQTLKVAHLKTARYGFAAPLVVGAMLGGGDPSIIASLEKIGARVGLAFQLRDDLISLFGDGQVSGKSTSSDFVEGRRSFPVIAAWTRGTEAERDALNSLWSLPKEDKDQRTLDYARERVEARGGVTATSRVIERCTRAAMKQLSALPLSGDASSARSELLSLIHRLSSRAS